MNTLKFLIVLTLLLIVSMGMSAETNSNYPLYSINQVVAYEVSEDARMLFTIEQTHSDFAFVRRDLSTGSVDLNVPLAILPAHLMNTVLVDDDIFLFHFNILDREKQLAETSIYRIDGSNGQLVKLYQSQEFLGFAEKFYSTQNGLLMTEKRGDRPFLFSLETNEMTAIDLGEDFRIRSFDFEKNCAVIIEQENFSTSFKGNDKKSTYTEGDGSLLPVHLCDFSADFELRKVGQYQPSYVLSKNEDESFLPHFEIESVENAWVESSFMMNRFPVYPGGLIGDTFLYGTYESLVGYENITRLTYVSDLFVLATPLSETRESSLVVYDIKNPKTEKSETVSKRDQERIKSLLMGKTTVEKTVMDPDVISRVFDAMFYKIDLVTTEVDSSDGSVWSMSSTETFMVVARDDDYSVLKQNEELEVCVASGFTLNEESALLFQNALDVLYPLGHFAEKHRAFYKEENHWFFVRDESFGEKEGFMVTVDENGEIGGIGLIEPPKE